MSSATYPQNLNVEKWLPAKRFSEKSRKCSVTGCCGRAMCTVVIRCILPELTPTRRYYCRECYENLPDELKFKQE